MENETIAEPFETIFQKEIERIQKKPGKQNTTKDNLVSLSLSGGGIRSASFCLGVIHALVAKDKLCKVDYLSTVSGGSFIGSSLTWALHKNKNRGESVVKKEGFPLGSPGAGSTSSKVNNALNYIRQQVSYLCPGKGIDELSLIGLFFRGIVIGNIVYVPIIALVLFLLQPWNLSSFYKDAAIGLIGSFLMISTGFSVLSYLLQRFFYTKESPRVSTRIYKMRNFCQKILGKIIVGTILFFLLWSLKPVSDFFDQLTTSILSAAIPTMIGYVGILIQATISNKSKKKSLSGQTIGIAASIILVYGLLLFAYLIAHSFPNFLWISLACSIVLGLLSNLNLIGLHRMYQDRIMETFMPDEKSVDSLQWDIALEASSSLLQDMCDEQTAGPYHICCATLTLKNSLNRKFRSRFGDSFIMSPLYCGSLATGWQKTQDFMKGKFHLATAVAISGAAVNPNAGISGGGITVIPIISFLMTLLNLRLGYWAPNPNHRAAKKGWTPNFFYPGFQDLLGIGYHEKSPFLLLTDGVNFENLALYEMIRRKVKFAIVCDIATELTPISGSLTNAIEKVRVDFGVSILFEDPEYNLKNMFTGTGESGPFQTKFQTAKRGYAIGDIYYPDGTRGKILLIKPTMTDDLPSDIYGYQNAHPDFPHQSTANQFFDEAQFEAYRELGYRLGSSALNHLDDDWNVKV